MRTMKTPTRMPLVSHYCPLTQTLTQPGPQIGRSLGRRWSHRLYIRSTTGGPQYRWYVRTYGAKRLFYFSFLYLTALSNALHYTDFEFYCMRCLFWKRIFCDNVSDAFNGLLFPLPLALPLFPSSVPPSLSFYLLSNLLLSTLSLRYLLHPVPCCALPCHAVLCCAALCAAGSTRRSSSWRIVSPCLSNLESHTRMVTLRQSVTDTHVMLCLAFDPLLHPPLLLLLLLSWSAYAVKPSISWPEPEQSRAKQSYLSWWHVRWEGGNEWKKERGKERER